MEPPHLPVALSLAATANVESAIVWSSIEEHVRGVVDEAVNTQWASAGEEHKIVADIKQDLVMAGIVDDLVSSIRKKTRPAPRIGAAGTRHADQFSGAIAPGPRRAQQPASTSQPGPLRGIANAHSDPHTVRIQVHRGRAFLHDFAPESFIHLDVFAFGSRSRCTVRATIDPTFNLTLGLSDRAVTQPHPSWPAFVLVAATTNPHHPSPHLLGAAFITDLAAFRTTSQLVPLTIQGGETTGLLEVRLQCGNPNLWTAPLPSTPPRPTDWTDPALDRWWRSVTQILRARYPWLAPSASADDAGTSANDDHFARGVVLWVHNESGHRLAAPHLITPIRDLRTIPTARHAIRFVKLLPTLAAPTTGTARSVTDTSCWPSPQFTLACIAAASARARCVLLVSLLRGLSLDAYVTLGTSPRGAVLWVTVLRQGSTGVVEAELIDIAGTRTGMPATAVSTYAPDGPHGWTGVSCLFSDRGVLVSVQDWRAPLSRVSWDVKGVGWRAMWVGEGEKPVVVVGRKEVTVKVDDRIGSFFVEPEGWASRVPLIRPRMDVDAVETAVQDALMAWLATQRHYFGLVTVWNAALGGAMHQLLASMDAQSHWAPTSVTTQAPATAPNSFDMHHFESAIRALIPPSWSFRGAPSCILLGPHVHALSTHEGHISEWARGVAARAMADWARHDVTRALVSDPSDEMRFACAVRVVVYGEAVAAWMVVGAAVPPEDDDEEGGE
ncbi:Centrosomal protein of 76 kDa [Allomyces javanicus]|nr:Centrosomal protein of 76 kDa [Allomyces javanicus]